jgi:hypothetical protein
MQVPQEVEGVLQFILPVVTRYRDKVGQGCGGSAELEVRLGQRVRREDGGVSWEPNVGAPLFHVLLELLQGFTGWCRVEEAQDGHDYFYTIHVQDGDGGKAIQKVRTSVLFGERDVKLVHACKALVAGCDVKLLNQPCDARVSLKTEVPVASSLLPPMVEPYLVRLKKRWSFWLDKWRFDLTQVWSGVSRAVAEANQSRNFCTYEVEVECVCSPSVVATLSSEYLALSLLLKLWSLLGGGLPVRMLPLTC